MKKTFALIAFCLGITGAHAATLVDWNLDTVTGPTENNASFTGVANTVATVADNLSVTNLVTASSPGHAGLVWSSGNAGPNKLNLQRWDHPADNPASFGNGNGTPNNWLQFSLTADPGYTFTLTTIDLSAWRNGGGAPANWAFDYSTNNGETWTQFGSTHDESENAGDGVFRDATFTDSVTSSELLIRFTAVGPTGGTGNLHINKMILVGTVIPEPTAALLGSLGLLTLLRRRR